MCELVTQFSVDQQIQIINTIGTWLAAIGTTAAVIVSLRISGRAERVANKPRLQLHTNISTNDPIYAFIGVEVENVGTGPALLLPMLFFHRGQFVGTNEKTKMKALTARWPNVVSVMAVHRMAYLRAGERRRIFWVERDEYGLPGFDDAVALISETNVVIPFSTPYGEVAMLAVRDDLDDTAVAIIARNVPKKINVAKWM